ncbi:MAG: DUF1330 domain-containing protein [Alphaproteobacteria bacterium]
MEVINAVNPDPQQAAEFFSDAAENKPVYMVNMLKFKDKAAYADGRKTTLSGRDAYALYGDGVKALLAEVGAAPVFGGEVTGLMLGTVEELWDEVVIVKYPSKAAIVQMFSSPAYQEIHVHRDAGLEGQLNISVNANDDAVL